MIFHWPFYLHAVTANNFCSLIAFFWLILMVNLTTIMFKKHIWLGSCDVLLAQISGTKEGDLHFWIVCLIKNNKKTHINNQISFILGDSIFQKLIQEVSLTNFYLFFFVQETVTESTPLRCRKLSNPDIFSSGGKTKLHRQLSQDDCKLRRGSLASSLSGMPFCKDRMTIRYY